VSRAAADPLDFPPDDALNAICPYWTMFPLDFPLQALAGGHPGEWVLDPFCGRGTTLFAARKLGMGTVGIDS
jgi:DNA modification methylase